MNRPTIKGTPFHKASIAKAKAKSQSIVSQRRTQADAGLLGASESLALSNVSKAQDYKLKSYDLNNISEKNKDNNTDELGEKGPKTPKKTKVKDPKTIKVEDPTGVAEATLEGTTKQAVEGTGPKTEAGKGYVQPKRKKIRVITSEENKNNLSSKEKEVTKIEPISIRKLPTSRKKIELQKATGTVQTKKSVDKFEAAAEKAGLPINTVEEYEKAEKLLVYDESTGNWRERVGGVSDTSTEFKSTSNIDPVAATTIKTKEELAIEAQVKENTEKTIQKEKYRVQAQKENRLDKAMAEKNIKASKKETIRLEKQAEINKKNEAIKARNKAIADAKKYYNTDKINKAQLEAYNEMIKKPEAEKEIEIIEENDPNPELDEYNRIKALNSNTPQIPPVQPKKNEVSARQKRLDLKYKLAGPSARANMEASGYTPSKVKSPVEMRDDRIYQFAKKDGPLRKNMIKSGYIPQN